MRTRWIVLAVVLLAALLGGAGAVYAYDHSRQDTIARGVKVDGVNVGGMSPEQAARRLRAALLDPLRRPVRAVYHGHRFTLTARSAAVGIDIQGSVERALARSRQGNMFSRSWRNLRGEAVRADLAARITWSRPAVKRVVARAHRVIDRPARDATVDLSEGKVEPTPSATGLTVRGAALARALERTLLDTGARHAVRVRTKVLHPEVTTGELAAKYPAVIVINRGAFTLTLYKDLKPAKTYPIAVGQVGLETPAGLYHVQNKAVNPAWNVPNSAWAGSLAGQTIPGGAANNPLKARWLGIYAGAGIHGTSDDGSIGTAASHGCIRMHIPDVIELYPQVPVGAPVYIS